MTNLECGFGRAHPLRPEPLAEPAYDAAGDLEGPGRFILTPTGDGTEVVFYWDVRTTGKALNVLGPLLKWPFGWNHNWVMARGERGLAEWLAREEADGHPCP